MFDRLFSRKQISKQPAPKEPLRGFTAPDVLLDNLARRLPGYLDDVDQDRLIYPACKRTLSDIDGDAGVIWDHTRLEAMRYVMTVPGHEFGLLSDAARQLEMIDAYLFQRPHADTVIDFSGNATADFSIAIVAGLELADALRATGRSRCGPAIRHHPPFQETRHAGDKAGG